MRTQKTLFLFIVSLCLQVSLMAQEKLNIKFGKVKPEDFNVQSLLIDSSTNAVVIADVGNSRFIANANQQTFSLIFRQKKRIKIINKKGFDAATITIPLYVGTNSNEEKLEDLDAYTYNLENGKVIETKLTKSSVFTEKHSKNWIYKKFTFPALKEGSIIEYSYEVKSDYFTNLQSWTFQGQYPVLWSQYETEIPDFFKYVTLSQGYHPFHIQNKEKSNISFQFTEHVERETNRTGAATSSGINNFKISGILEHSTWIMKDVHALKEESFTTTLRNAVSKIEFQLNQVAFPNTSPKDYMNSWQKVASELMDDEKFGLPIDRANNWMDDEVETIVANAKTQKEKAAKIFEYVRDNFTHNDIDGIYITKNLKDILKNKNGSIADINMLLIAMLRSQKMPASPVILSTRDNGFANEYYPLLNRYNYLIAKVEIDNAEIFLDATIKHLEFGKLPTKVYNGQAREITKKNGAPVYFIADSLKESATTFAFIINNEKGGIEGRFSQNFGENESLKLRNRMSKILMEDFKKSVQQQYPEEYILDNIQLDSLKLLKEPVCLKYDLTINAFKEEDIVYFNPMLVEAIKKNPFTAAERFYPVEMTNTIDDTYILTMEVPTGYKVDELPKSVRLSYNGDEGMFEYLISQSKESISLRCRTVLRKATFENEDYQSLRDFYTFIVKKEAEQIVFKKIK